MENPIDLILSALDAGARAQSQTVPSTPFKQTAYDTLKTRLEERLATDPHAGLSLDQYLLKPNQVTHAQLQLALASEQIDQEPAILEAAQRLLSQVPPRLGRLTPEQTPGSPPRPAESGKSTIHVAGNIQGFNSGDYNQVIMNFRRELREG